MKVLRVITQPFKLDDVKDALSQVGVAGLTASEVKGFGRQKGGSEVFRGAASTEEFVPRIALDVVIPDALLTPVLSALERTLRTGRVGDGKIFVSHVEEAIRVRTNERGDAAL